MRILIIGSNGKVGSALVDQLSDHHLHLVAGRDDVNITNLDRLSTMVGALKPAVIVNCSAMNGMETCEADPIGAFATNTIAPIAMAQLAAQQDALFVTFSSDYVLHGEDETGLTEDATPQPWGVYGHSKLAGEVGVTAVGGNSIILRVSSIYGPEPSGPTQVLEQAKRGRGTAENPVEVLHQFCAPTSAKFIAAATAHIINTVPCGRWNEVSGLYHLAASGGVWKKEFARYLLGPDAVIVEGMLDAPRPVYSYLDSTRFVETFGFFTPGAMADDSYGHLNTYMSRYAELQEAAD